LKEVLTKRHYYVFTPSERKIVETPVPANAIGTSGNLVTQKIMQNTNRLLETRRPDGTRTVVTNVTIVTNASYMQITRSGAPNVTSGVVNDGMKQELTKDADGNLLNDGRWNYTWDAENRLIRMISRSTTVGPQQRLDFEYDYMGRRIRKKVWENIAGSGSPSSDLKFLYEGWNLIAELNGASTDAVVRSYIWGIDLSGSFQGAGGVGGLLGVKLASGVNHFATYDGTMALR